MYNPSVGSDATTPTERRSLFPGAGITEGSEVGPYVVETLIGRGASGAVYQAHDPRLARSVALKLIDDLDEVLFEEQLVGEAQTLAKLSHPNIVPVFDLGLASDGRVWVAMELVRGVTIDEWAKEKAPNAVLRAWIDVARAVGHAHESGILHRDIKPGNVMVDEHDRVRVLDFGLTRDASLARLEHGDLSREFFGANSRPDVAQVIGTLNFMAPELFRGAALSPKSDQFSLCVALYRAMFDRDPFDSAARRTWVQGAPARPQPLPKRSSFETLVESVLLRGLDPAPDARWPSMDALADALAAIVDESVMDPFERVRARAQLGAVLIGLSVSLLAVERTRHHRPSPLLLAIASLGIVVVVSIASWRWRAQLYRTAFTRMLTTMVNLIAVTSFVHRAINAIDQVPPAITLRGDAITVAAGAAYIALFYDRAFWLGVVSSTAAALLCALVPQGAVLWFSLSQAIAIVLFTFRAVGQPRAAA